ncbi:hypothetical protein CEP54_006044 [Fusarium duplospermum]|uniref:Protein kinase domain-containing protein n=1 Tax=Fusarium duplospermum TaxID=1325734 RepID=A0A428Q8T9_9HYPO|nr:hypothetical protein CEP54_006044 [Fusarium duplospermum]
MGEMTEQVTRDNTFVEQICSGDGKGASIAFELRGRQSHVSIFPSNGSSTKDSRHLRLEDRPLQDHLIDALSRDSSDRPFGEHLMSQDEVLGAILKAGEPLFSRLTPKAPTCEPPTLHQILFAEILYFRLEGDSDPASLVTIESKEAYNNGFIINRALNRASEQELDLCQHLPRYAPEDIVVKHVFMKGIKYVTASVQVDGQDMFCKALGEPRQLQGCPEARELECLGKMLRAFPQQSLIRVPQLLGYVHDKDTKRILGFLRQWVPGRNLGEIYLPPIAAETKQKWILQIRESVQLLHEKGLVWGDVKPHNIVIDEQNDAWLIDFGGGFTAGWVDSQLAETMEGDEKALDRIAEFLSGNEYVIL